MNAIEHHMVCYQEILNIYQYKHELLSNKPWLREKMSKRSIIWHEHVNGSFNKAIDESVLCFEVMGTQYENRPQTIAHVTQGMEVLLRREPQNEYDSNAIAVLTEAGESLGHVPCDIAMELSPLLDAGWVVNSAHVSFVMPWKKRDPEITKPLLYVEMRTRCGKRVNTVEEKEKEPTISQELRNHLYNDGMDSEVWLKNKPLCQFLKQHSGQELEEVKDIQMKRGKLHFFTCNAPQKEKEQVISDISDIFKCLDPEAYEQHIEEIESAYVLIEWTSIYALSECDSPIELIEDCDTAGLFDDMDEEEMWDDINLCEYMAVSYYCYENGNETYQETIM